MKHFSWIVLPFIALLVASGCVPRFQAARLVIVSPPERMGKITSADVNQADGLLVHFAEVHGYRPYYYEVLSTNCVSYALRSPQSPGPQVILVMQPTESNIVIRVRAAPFMESLRDRTWKAVYRSYSKSFDKSRVKKKTETQFDWNGFAS